MHAKMILLRNGLLFSASTKEKTHSDALYFKKNAFVNQF